MISVENLTIEFSTKPLFKKVNFVINSKDKIALVGKNGAGKSTMLKILVGKKIPTEGNISIPEKIKIGYLPQIMKLQDETTLYDELCKSFAETIEMKKQLDILSKEMVERTDYESEEYSKLVETFTQLHEQFTIIGGENYDAEIERTITGLGFNRNDLQRQTAEFSGGWRMRIELGKILLSKPDVILLDEPTNHLDIESIRWLEQFLINCNASVVLVSHDKAFINNVTNRTLEISCGKVFDYKVKYNEYIKLREERRQQQIRAYQNQQKEIADIKDFIEKFRYKPTKAIQVQSRIKQLEKIIPIEIDEVDNAAIHLKFPPCLRSGDYPIICEELCKNYDEQNILENVNLTIKRGEKVAFVGKNGEGKSTLVKCIMNETKYTGKLKIGHNVQIGYFAQNQAQLLNEELTIFETIDQVAKGEIRLKIKNILGAFMFGGEIAEKKVKVLSGGERSRLAMIKLLLEPINLLILDEPTNHLDIASKEVLKEAIKAFDGTAIIVSHDRDFLDGLVTKVYEFANKHVTEHIGGIYDFLKKYDTSQQQNNNNIHKTKSDNIKQADNIDNNKNKTSYEEHKEKQKKINKAEKDVKLAEENIYNLEKKIKEISEMLYKPENASNMELINKYASIKKSLEEEEKTWEKASIYLEQLQNNNI